MSDVIKIQQFPPQEGWKNLPPYPRRTDPNLLYRQPGDGGADKFIPPADARAYRFVIRTPHAGFNGQRAGVKFTDGVGYTDDDAAADSCRMYGYAVEENPAKRGE